MFTITEQLTGAQLAERRTLCATLFGTIALPQDAPNWLQEIFYFVPMLLGEQLEKSGEYLAASDWYQTVYAYHLKDSERRIYHGLTKEDAIATKVQLEDDWLLEGLNPHKTSRERANAYTRYTIMSLVRCFLAGGDAEYTRDTDEALPRGRALYSAALDLLALPEMQPLKDAAGNALPPNPVYTAQRRHVELPLFKLRNGYNIAGLERPRQGDGLGGQQSVTRRPTAYRYATLIARANQFVEIAQQVEAAFLQALQQRNAEAYTLLKARQDLQLTQAGVQLQVLRTQEAADGLVSTRRGNGEHWKALQGASPLGEWELALPNTPEVRARFQENQIEDLHLVVTYSGSTAAWPA